MKLIDDKSKEEYDKFLKSKENNDYIMLIYHIMSYLFHNLRWLIKYLISIFDLISRETENFFYNTCILEKSEEVEDEVFTNANKREKNKQKDLEISFHSERRKNLSDYNEAAKFIDIQEPQCLMSSNTEKRIRNNFVYFFNLKI